MIERLLERVAHENPQLDQPGDRKDWIKRTLERDELLGAGAVVEVMADEDLDTLLPQALMATLAHPATSRAPSHTRLRSCEPASATASRS